MTPNVSGPGITSIKAAFVEPEVPEEYSGPPIDLSSIREALSRRRKVWIGLGLAGLVIGAALHFFIPAKYSAVSDLFMDEPASASAAQAIANDVSLLETRSVAAEAIAKLHLTANPTSFLSHYQGTATSNNIVTIKLTASSPAEAVAYDNAVAQAFLKVRAQEMALQINWLSMG